MEACNWSGHIFGASASLRPLTKKNWACHSSTVHGGLHDTKYVTVELLLHVAFVADEIWGDTLEPVLVYILSQEQRASGLNVVLKAGGGLPTVAAATRKTGMIYLLWPMFPGLDLSVPHRSDLYHTDPICTTQIRSVP